MLTAISSSIAPRSRTRAMHRWAAGPGTWSQSSHTEGLTVSGITQTPAGSRELAGVLLERSKAPSRLRCAGALQRQVSNYADTNCITDGFAVTNNSFAAGNRSACQCGLREIQAVTESASTGRENR